MRPPPLTACMRGVFCVGRGWRAGPCGSRAPVVWVNGRMPRLPRPEGIVRVCFASHGLRYTTFFEGDGRWAVGFVNLWLAGLVQARVGRVVAQSDGHVLGERSLARCGLASGEMVACLTRACAGRDGRVRGASLLRRAGQLRVWHGLTPGGMGAYLMQTFAGRGSCTLDAGPYWTGRSLVRCGLALHGIAAYSV